MTTKREVKASVPYYPVFLNLNERPCLIVGGGRVAERKALSLVEAGARVTIVSPRLTKGLQALAKGKKGNKIKHIKRKYAPGDMEGFFIAIIATGSKAAGRMARRDADAFGVPLNVADAPALCDFITPAVVSRGSVRIAVSSSGKSPLLSKKLARLLDETLPPELAIACDILGAVRNKLLKKKVKSGTNRKIYNALLGSPIIEWIRRGERERINVLLKELLGPGCTLSALGVRLGKDARKKAGASRH